MPAFLRERYLMAAWSCLNQGEKGETVYYTTDGSDPEIFGYPHALQLSNCSRRQSCVQITAVNHSGSGQSAAGMVSTYRYVPASTDGCACRLIDSLDNFKLIANRTNLYIAKNNPASSITTGAE